MTKNNSKEKKKYKYNTIIKNYLHKIKINEINYFTGRPVIIYKVFKWQETLCGIIKIVAQERRFAITTEWKEI